MTPIRCIAYTRVSSEAQAGEKQTSLADQRVAIEALATQLGQRVADDSWYEDAGLSGGTAEKRPAFMRLLAYCKANPRTQRSPGFVLALNSSRWGRFVDPRESEYWAYELQRVGWIVRFCENDSVTDPKLRNIVRVLEATQSTSYRETLSANVRRGMRGTANQGYTTHVPPIGYARKVVYPSGSERILPRGARAARGEKTKLVRDESGEAEFVECLFSLYASGTYSLNHLVAVALEEWPSRKWTRKAISNILKNVVYLGHIQGGVRCEHRTQPGGLGLGDPTPYGLEDAHEPLISRDVFDAVQRRLASQRQLKTRPHSPYALSGIVTCTGCGQPYVGNGTTVAGNGAYSCGGKTRDRGRCSLPGSQITAYLLENAIVDDLAQYFRKPSVRAAVAAAIDARLEAIRTGPAPDTAAIDAEIASVVAERNRVVSALRGGVLSEAECHDAMEDIRQRLVRLETRKATAERHAIRPSLRPDERARLLALADELPARIRTLKGQDLRRVLLPWIRGARYDRQQRQLVLEIRWIPKAADSDEPDSVLRGPPRSLLSQSPESECVASGDWRVFCRTDVRAFFARATSCGAFMSVSWQANTLVQCVSTRPWLTYPGCDEPGGCHDLTLGKIYEMLSIEGKGSFYRIVDDSGEDYLYPVSHFRVI